MRHILQAGAVTAGSLSVGKAAATAGLVAPARLPDRVRSGRLRAVGRAVDLAAVAVAADEHLRPAAHAHKESARGLHWRLKSRQGDIDRAYKLVKYSPCTRARHGVGHDIGPDLVV